MRLHVQFDPGKPPHQQGLNVIPSSQLVGHPAIKAALERYEQARTAEHEARLAAVQAEQDLGEADELDAVALADAIASSKRDPGAKNREKALGKIEDTRRQHKATTILLGRAVEGVNEAFAEHGADYEASLNERNDALREQMGRCLDEYAERLMELRRTREAQRLVERRPLGLDSIVLPGKKANGDHLMMSPEEVLEKLRGVGAPHEQKAAPRAVGFNQGTTMPVPEDGPRHRSPSFQRALDPQAPVARQAVRESRLERKADKAAEREARRQAEDEAIEAVA